MSSLVLNEEVAELVTAIKPSLKAPLIKSGETGKVILHIPWPGGKATPTGFPTEETYLVCVAFEGPLPWEVPFSVRPTRWQEPVSSWSVRSSLNDDCNQY